MKMRDESFSKRCAALAPKLLKAFESRYFEAYYCENAEAAADSALGLIPENASVSWGGSVTIREIGLPERLHAGNYRVVDRERAATLSERMDLMRQALLCDFYLTSVNALSEDAQLVNVDGNGNRVAAMAFGPKNVIVVVGMNKLCKTVEDAQVRARTTAAPLNAQRIAGDRFLKTERALPCVRTGVCSDCKSDECICAITVTTRLCKPARRVKLILVGEPLGD
ncbi:MAG: lactate utilization protein [Candidatus Accumulibacter sp.]|jgi:L-lactate utilization protein LutB|nr:lactate utilization protein [Accumulibacter sp.]